MGFLLDATRLVSSQPKGGRPKKDRSTILHGKILWSAWVAAEGGEDKLIRRHGLTRAQNADGFGLRADELGLLRNGRLSLSPGRLAALGKMHPTVGQVISWPFALLTSGPLSAGTLRKLMAPFIQGDSSFLEWDSPVIRANSRFRTYRFGSPHDQVCCGSEGGIVYHDLERLYERGDPMGFFAIVEAFRSKALNRDTDSQWITAHWMIKALPGLCRHSAAKPHSAEVIALTNALLRHLPDTCWPIQIDEHILHSQIAAALHVPSRNARDRAAALGKTVPEPLEPFVHHKLIHCDEMEAPALPSFALPKCTAAL